MTARDLITGSLRLLGVVASGEALGAAEATDGLASLNQLIDSWSTQSLLIPNRVREVLSLTPGKQTYTMGVGGEWNTSRPMELTEALLQLSTGSPALELPLEILRSDEEYARIRLKGLSSTFPRAVYSDGAAPLANVSLYPVPTGANHLVLYSAKPLADLTALTTTLSLPPGYERALRYNLAIELAPEYGREPSELVAANAVESKATIKRANHRPRYLKVDSALRSRGGTWNWLTGGYT